MKTSFYDRQFKRLKQKVARLEQKLQDRNLTESQQEAIEAILYRKKKALQSGAVY